jgi:hypothetical protein
MKLINKFNIKEEDLYILSVIEKKKETSSFFEKEKLKAKSMGVLKPYNVKFMDLGILLSEIKAAKFAENTELIEKYGIVNLDSKKSSTGIKYIIPIVIIFLAFFFFFNINDSDLSSEATSANVETKDGTIDCLVKFDWVYPSSGSPIGAWKFSSDGTFNYSTSGGMSAWGNWEVISAGKIKISYTKTSEGIVPENQTLTMSSCNSLKVGLTTYSKN